MFSEIKLSDRNPSINFDKWLSHFITPFFPIIFCCIYFERAKYDKLKIGNYMKNKYVQIKHLIGYTCSTLRNAVLDNKLLY